MKELIGQTLGGRYQLQSLLGAGGMGGVFKARDLTLQRIVALKVMRPEIAQQPDFRKRFLQEAQAAARLEHSGVVKVYDFNQAGALLYIVMEFISGPTLQDRLEELNSQKRFMPLPEALLLIRQLALALAYIHTQGVLHRDLKPANIILKPQSMPTLRDGLPYQPVITDLGLAKLQEGGLTTQIGMPVGGTPTYMSPEQVQGRMLDARSDVYSLGVLLYQLTVGQRPFPIKGMTDAVNYHVFQKPPPPQTLRPDLPAPLAAIIMRTLEKDPARRFASATALAQALDGLFQQVPSSPPPSQRHPWMAILLILIFGLVVWQFARLLTQWTARNGRENPTTVAIVDVGSIRSPTPLVLSITATVTPASMQRPTEHAANPASAAPTATASNTPSSAATISIATKLPAPTATLVPAIVAPPTSTLMPTRTATPTARPTPTRTRMSTTSASSRAVMPTPQATSNLTVQLLTPPDKDNGQGRRMFSWLPNFELTAGQAFEVVFWQEGQAPFGITGPTTGTQVTVNLNPLYDKGLLQRGEYKWGVLLVTTTPYTRIQSLSDGNHFFFEPSTESGDQKAQPSSPLRLKK